MGTHRTPGLRLRLRQHLTDLVIGVTLGSSGAVLLWLATLAVLAR